MVILEMVTVNIWGAALVKRMGSRVPPRPLQAACARTLTAVVRTLTAQAANTDASPDVAAQV